MEEALVISIIQKVKEALQIKDEVEVVELYKKLSKARAKSHPDNFTDPEAKEGAEEQFKHLNELSSEMKAYLEMQRLKSIPALYDEEDKSYQLVTTISECNDKDDEIAEIREVNKHLQQKLEISKREIETLQDQLNESIEAQRKIDEKELKKIYETKRTYNFIGWSAFVALFIIQIPQVKDAIKLLGLADSLGTYLLWVIVILFLLYHLRQWLIYKRSTNVENLLLTSSKLESLLNIEVYQRRYSKYEECYFMENDIYAIVKSQFSLFLWKLLWFGDINTLTKAIGNKLIAELIKKKVITIGPTEGLDRMFIINSNVSGEYRGF